MLKRRQRPARSGWAEKGVNPRIVQGPIGILRSFTAANPHLSSDPIVQSILDHLGRGDYARAVEISGSLLRPEFGSDPGLMASTLQFKAFFEKIPFPGDSDKRKVTALSAFHKAERLNRITNRRLQHYLFDNTNRLWKGSSDVRDVVFLAREKIRQVLGSLTEHKYLSILRGARPGGGVCLGTRLREKVAPVFKYTDSDPVAYPDSLPIVLDYLRQNQGLCFSSNWIDWSAGKVRTATTTANRVSFVPKNAKTFRSIAVEPNLSLILQLGVHEYLRKLFERRGVAFIDDQRPNQLYSRLGSMGSSLDNLSTIDLSMASDTMSYKLVEFLIPSDWFELFRCLRAPSTLIDGVTFDNAKFSSMGNGLTFALETLVFWGLSESARLISNSNGLVSVYGDDIVIPSSAALLLTEVLQFCGLIVNNEKSFITGNFKESCGTFWYRGRCITPVYLRDYSLRYMDLCRIYNSTLHIDDEAYKSLRSSILGLLKPFGLRFGLQNEDLGSCIFTSFAYAKGCGALKYSPDIQNYTFYVMAESQKSYVSDEYREYLSSLLSGRERSLPLKGRTSFVKRKQTQGKDPRWFVAYLGT